ncbi:ROK family protein [Streptomyces pluripotens]|uniref:ROK family protein n=1 Tax=Streptomyces pluripotens TaxID=1355015 RepID=A0A221P7N1_9ACTN|nr:sugar kinase [Streptomyces pluripotens]ASN28124.1 ROK family protein [Streptomyces pluripotens]KIE26754.1 sugar kinase [Streptomyces sp. MUSC 125]MCH0559259.1 ROK family protein [Streptomyces sp. MUM 16J]
MFAGVDIGGTTTQVVLCTTGLNVLDRVEAPTPAAEGGQAMMHVVLEALRRLLDRVPARLVGVGVGAAGVVDARRRRILVASDSFHAWAGFPVAATIETALGVPAFLDNDVNAFLRGEVSKGALEGESDALGMTLGTGVGGALWMDGELFDGPHGAAGEIGHIPGFGDRPCSCGGSGHLEMLASGRAIAARYEERTGRRTTAQGVAAAAGRGDPDARAVFEIAGSALARAILMVAGVVDVTTVVIGGGVSRAWRLLEPSILRALAAEPSVSGRPIRIVQARLGRDAVAIGAASRAQTEFGVAAPW